MSSDTTIDAVRLALSMQQLQAHVASLNIANANRPGAQAMRVDLSTTQDALRHAAATPAGDTGATAHLAQALHAISDATPVASGEDIVLDRQVGDAVMAGTRFQALSEALARHFGMMRLAIAGRS